MKLMLPEDAVASPLIVPVQRHGYRSQDWRTRSIGLGGALAVPAAMLALAVLRWVSPAMLPNKPAPMMVELLPLAAPPEPVREVPEGKVQEERRASKLAEPVRPEPPKVIVPHLLTQPTTPSPPVEPAPNAEPVPETTAPKSTPAPPAPRMSSNAPASCEARLLAHLEKYRRYPASAKARREQGVAYVRFRMNRAGRVLDAALLRSSGNAALDRAALETIRRAQPLPAIPEDRADELQLSVPVEFTVR